MTRRGRGAARVLAVVLCAVPLVGRAAPPPARPAAAAPGRALAPADLEGDWLSARFLDAVRATRAPVRAPEPLAFSVRRHGSGWRLEVTTFHEGTWRAITGIETKADGTFAFLVGPPEREPKGPAEVSRLRFSAVAGAAGIESVSGSFWEGASAKVTFRRLPAPRARYLNRIVLAGTYRDEEGRAWAFDASGEAAWPGEGFRYGLNLDPSEAGCDYLTRPDESQPGGTRRYAFAWKDGALRLSHVVYDRDFPISAASRPFAVLRPEAPDAPAPARKGLPPRGVALAPLSLEPLHEGAFDELVGGGSRVEVHFREKGARRRPEVLTAPPAVVRRLDRPGECRIDGGNWTPEAVWLSRDETLLALGSFSGSSSELELFDTATCRKVGSVDTSLGTVEVTGDRIDFSGGCEWSDETHGRCAPAGVFVLDDAGVPKRLVPESRERTRKRFGIAFDAPSEIEFPGGGRPREREGKTPLADAPRILKALP